VFGIPIAAVLSAFFFHWFERSREGGSVADRATKRLEAREGRPVRRPKEPVPGVDEDLDDARPKRQAHPLEEAAAELAAAAVQAPAPPESATPVEADA